MRRFLVLTVTIIVLIAAVFFVWRFYIPFGEGVKSGELNYVVKKGYIFKTYEGKLIQSGIRSRQPGSIQSYEFEFSVQREDIAQKLMVNSGKEFVLHYKEYYGKLPWRGYSVFVVDSILSMKEIR
ncbi:MAG: hypothetical protein INR73_17045 [Williamsia sp.]|nr:hypothetical protein [Williamsia sp.]